ncbi:hypothetical protein JCM10212_004465 [Sporobolomyces blumeae]
MFKRIHHARIPLHHLVHPPSTPSPPPPPRRVACSVPAIDRSIPQPSTSTVPYAPPPRSRTARPYSTSSRHWPAPRYRSKNPVRPLEQLLELPERDTPLHELVEAFRRTLSTVSRPDFDRVFARVARVEFDGKLGYLRELRRAVIKRRRWKLDRDQVEVVLREALVRERMYRVHQRLQERRSDAARSSRQGDESVVVDNGKGKEKLVEPEQQDADESVWAQRHRQNYSDELYDEYTALIPSRPTRDIRNPQRKAIADVLELFAEVAALRPDSTTRDQLGRSLSALRLSLAYSTRRERAEHVNDDLSTVFRKMFERGRGKEAVDVLNAMARKGRVMTIKGMKEIVRGHYALHATPGATRGAGSIAEGGPDAARDVDEYAQARRILDQVCDASASPFDSLARDDPPSTPSSLDELFRLRLERVDRLEEVEKDPRGAFIKWIGLQQGGLQGDEGREDPVWLEAALRMWEAGVRRDEDGLAVMSRSEVGTLSALVRAALDLGSAAAAGESLPKDLPPLVVLAADIAMRYMPLQVLIHHSARILPALTRTSSASLDDAIRLVNLVLSPPADFPFAHFQWSATLLEPFTRLFLSSQRDDRDPSLPLRLYLSWTASGLTFPRGLWDSLWRSLGRRGSIEELDRVLLDWEETGRGPAESRIVHQVLKGAIDAHRVGSALRQLDFFRSRYSPIARDALRPDTTPTVPRSTARLDPLVVPLESYNLVLALLATARHDYRLEISTVFGALLADGHAPSTETYNALLASEVTRATFSVVDVDSAGVIYNKLARTGLEPDRDTFTWLMVGFNRLAQDEARRERTERDEAHELGARTERGEPTRKVGLEASLRTFRASCARSTLPSGSFSTSSVANRSTRPVLGTLAKGRAVSSLMRLLALDHRFEEAKQVSEEWWRALVKVEEAVGTRDVWNGREVEEECGEMKRAAVAVEKLERQAVEDPGRVEGDALAP